MIEIINDSKILRITPFQRENTPDIPEYDWIRIYVEYVLPELKAQYQASLNVGELNILKNKLAELHIDLVNGREAREVVFDSMENQLNLTFSPLSSGCRVLLALTLRPENPAESVVVSDNLVMDESYFPALLSGLNEIINWPS
ncbi:WapI family immunity protein [Pluralibacter gergoviae]|uniref:WapI family immunity protein n=1 Tax=Pluralibacter gergoviae TaxID=61647 RepID=UPI003EE15327